MSRLPEKGWPTDVIEAVREAVSSGIRESDKPLPLDLLGDFEEYCRCVARSVGVATEMVFPPMLGAASSIVGGYIQVAGPAWLEPINLWALFVAGPGERKSPVLRAVMAPVYDVQSDWESRVLPDVSRATTAKELAIKRAATAVQEAAKDLAGGERGLSEKEMNAYRLSLAAEEIVVPAVPAVVLDDFTPEKLAEILATQGGTAACVSDEGGNFFGSPNKYQSGPANMDVLLKSWRGDPVRVDRVKLKQSLTIARPILTVCLALQPGLLTEVARGAALHRGLMARFLYFFPPSLAGTRPVDVEPVPKHLTEEWSDRLHDLAEQVWKVRSGDDLGPVTLGLSDRARAIYRDFRENLEASLDDERFQSVLNGFSGKIHGQVLRLAGLGHCLRRGSIEGEITGGTMRAAVDMVPYLIDQAFRVQDLVGRAGGLSKKHKLLRWASGWREAEFTARDAYRGLSWTPEDAEGVMDVLVEDGDLIKIDGKRTTKYRLAE